MGRTKNYLRYVHESSFNLVAASQAGSGIKYLHMRNSRDRFVAVPANDNVYIWDLKTRQIIIRLVYESDSAAEVTVLECHHGGHARTNLIAVGYANGHVRVYEYETGMLKSTFTGHRTAISALAFDKEGSRMASGGKDCSIVLWDIVSERGLFSLKGHKNSISKLAFIFNDEHQKDLLFSSSVDAVSTIKIWDLQLQHCFCTIPGHAAGVWSFVLIKDGTRLITGSNSPELKVYSINYLSEQEKLTINKDIVDEDENLGLSEMEYGVQVEYLGNILRNSNAISNRVQDLVVDPDETMLVCHSVDKNVEFYGLRSPEEALIYAKKQTKKAVKKQAKRKLQAVEEDANDVNDAFDVIDSNSMTKPVSSLNDIHGQRLVDCEMNRKLGTHRMADKVRSLDIVKSFSRDEGIYKLVIMTASNKIDCINFEPKRDAKEPIERISSIESLSHRSDARSLAISSDNNLIMSASAESAKIWRLDSRNCIATIDIDHATCCLFANAQHIETATFKNRFALVGTKSGCIQVIDIADANVIDTIEVCNDAKPITSMFVIPDKTGIVCGGEDGVVRFFNYSWVCDKDEDGQKKTILKLEPSRVLEFQEGITCVNVSANNKMLAVALLDSTVRIHFLDTFKYFLTMYGHKFPVTTMDISDDNTIIATGSPDKNIKIWGLDFGDCHKSIFAHDDSITCVRFVPKTHHLFSCARDRQIKQWDCDHFIKIQTLKKHLGEIWTLAISQNGKYVVSSSHDKSIRIYRKTEEILVPSEEDETERELEDERNVYEKQENIVLGEANQETGFAVKMTIDTIKSTDRLIEAIDVYLSEKDAKQEYLKQCEIAESRGEKMPAEPDHHPLMMTTMTTDYNRFLLEIMRRIKPSELEEVLITLPFDYVSKLLHIIVDFLDRAWDVELMVRCATFLIRMNFGQIAASPQISSVIHKMKAIVLDRTRHLRECTGFNLLALEHLSQYRKYQSTKIM